MSPIAQGQRRALLCFLLPELHSSSLTGFPSNLSSDLRWGSEACLSEGLRIQKGANCRWANLTLTQLKALQAQPISMIFFFPILYRAIVKPQMVRAQLFTRVSTADSLSQISTPHFNPECEGGSVNPFSPPVRLLLRKDAQPQGRLREHQGLRQI